MIAALRLRVIIGITTALLAGWWFVSAATELRAADSPSAADRHLALWFAQHATPARTRIAEVITFFGSATFLAPAGIGAALLLLRRRDWYWASALMLTVGGGGLLNVALKNLLQRPRPSYDEALVHASGYSFPSGHTMGAVLFYGSMTVLVATHVKTRCWQMLAPAPALLAIVLIGLSRVYLGAHYVSDVTAAAAAGLAWLALCLTVVEIIRRRRTGRLGLSRQKDAVEVNPLHGR